MLFDAKSAWVQMSAFESVVLSRSGVSIDDSARTVSVNI